MASCLEATRFGNDCGIFSALVAFSCCRLLVRTTGCGGLVTRINCRNRNERAFFPRARCGSCAQSSGRKEYLVGLDLRRGAAPDEFRRDPGCSTPESIDRSHARPHSVTRTFVPASRLSKRRLQSVPRSIFRGKRRFSLGNPLTRRTPIIIITRAEKIHPAEAPVVDRRRIVKRGQ